MKLTQLKGVGPEKAEKLRDAGFNMVEDIAVANINVLDEVSGVDAKKILMEAHRLAPEYKDRQTKQNIKRPYICRDCGYRSPTKAGLTRHQQEGDDECIYKNWGRSRDSREKKAKYARGY
ncbi:helix-hairpin-helix domain-containing protein [Halomicrococcus gelatinilyticus]|uniref:helix-hairpin-helix domain-containing protein n=1 Tax=Halomicrococcus gelatinilyticus TaxID=1702103 RepID=UPI002E0D919B